MWCLYLHKKTKCNNVVFVTIIFGGHSVLLPIIQWQWSCYSIVQDVLIFILDGNKSIGNGHNEYLPLAINKDDKCLFSQNSGPSLNASLFI